jgi:DNA-binding beta-propeller fold protein YncE
MFWKMILSILLISSQGVFAAREVRKVDFLDPAGLQVNGAGPLLVRLDTARNRLFLVNTLTSSISIIDCESRSVCNIPISSRVPQYLKSEALAIDSRTGNAYVIGNKTLEVVFPQSKKTRTFPTKKQFEMVAVDESSGNAFLVGRESREMAFVDLNKNRVRTIPWCEKEEVILNLNQTPPPPIRKVVCDQGSGTVLAVDGYTSTLHVFAAADGKPLRQRRLDLVSGARWHFAAYSQKQHALLLVVETADRQVVQAAKISAGTGPDTVITLPGYTEAVGISYNEKRDELYIPYDNHASLHVIDFKNLGLVSEIKLPAYGNDASALDAEHDLLYVASWAYGEIDQIDLQTRMLRKRFFQAAVLPHMFNMAFNPRDGKLYLPLGATAVNGSFGAAVSVLDPENGSINKVRSGWAPQELLQQPGSDAFLVFNNEDQFARVTPDGNFTIHTLPEVYPHQALATPAGNVYLAYGPHQSYWPAVYIWAARNGILGMNGRDLEYYGRRIPRLAQGMVLTPEGGLFALQNNWGDEKQFLITLGDEIRSPNQGDMRLELPDTVGRETSQRLLAFDEDNGWLCLARVGEKDSDNGVLQIIDAKAGKVLKRFEIGPTPTGLAVDRENIYVLSFDADRLTIIRKADFGRRDVACGRNPLKFALAGGVPYVINHGDNTLSELGPKQRVHRIPFPGRPDQVVYHESSLLITSHSAEELLIMEFDLKTKIFSLLHREKYPFGETTFAGNNSSFFVRGQFGDCLYDLCKIKTDAAKRIWISDFLSGKLFIIGPQ